MLSITNPFRVQGPSKDKLYVHTTKAAGQEGSLQRPFTAYIQHEHPYDDATM
jgi:hypothetical protein